MLRRKALLGLGGAGLLAAAAVAVFLLGWPRPAGPRLLSIGPPLISNQAAYPLVIRGEGLTEGLLLSLGAPVSRELPTTFVDERQLTAQLPAGVALDPQVAVAELSAKLLDAGGRTVAGAGRLAIVNDAAFVVPKALVLLDGTAVIASPPTDELLVIDPGAGPARRVPAGDGPVALAAYRDPTGASWLLLAHELSGELWILPAGDLGKPAARIPLGHGLAGLAVDATRGLAYVSGRNHGLVHVVELAGRTVVRTLPAGVQPGPLALGDGGNKLLVSNRGSEDLSLIDLASGMARRVSPGPGTPIIGGHTEPYSRFVMGGKSGRSVVWSERARAFLVSSIGPSIGPNPDRMEVSMNGGVAVIDAAGGYLRHVSILRGLPEGLAVDDERGLLYAADVATGRVVILDAAKLSASDEAARGAILGELLLPPGEGGRIRPPADFGVQGRATEALHAGPFALALGGDGQLQVLCRLRGALLGLDTSSAGTGLLTVSRTVALPGYDAQPNRRLGEVLFFTDLGNSRMTCDACHPDGGTGGVIFEKTTPLRIYRATTLRGSRDSPPYFTPSMLPSLRHTARDVLTRNRFRNPEPLPAEIAALASYNEALAPPPNPWLGPDGTLPRALRLPDGRSGDAVRGLSLFEAKGCPACHPAPAFTLDHAEATRGRLFHVGTPLQLPLRPELQDPVDPGWPVPSLVGVWANFPLLASGAGGLSVAAGGTLVASEPFALRRVLELPGAEAHGGAAALGVEERDDLLAYLLTL